MADIPNAADFSVDDKPRQYDVRIHVEGNIHRTVEADSEDEARRKAEEIEEAIFADRDSAEIDDLEDIRVASCRRATPMFRVIRDGQKMQVSRLTPGDVPREPDERGF